MLHTQQQDTSYHNIQKNLLTIFKRNVILNWEIISYGIQNSFPSQVTYFAFLHSWKEVINNVK